MENTLVCLVACPRPFSPDRIDRQVSAGGTIAAILSDLGLNRPGCSRWPTRSTWCGSGGMSHCRRTRLLGCIAIPRGTSREQGLCNRQNVPLAL